jgi:hypothetical protein
VNDLLFLVADTNMREALAGFLERKAVDRIVGCRRFDFDARRDIKVAAGQCDPGLYKRASELLKPFRDGYRRAVVVADEEWEGSPGAAAFESRLQAHLAAAGWRAEDALALVVRPEVDNWLWSDSPHSAEALGWDSWQELSAALQGQALLVAGEAKPARPKEAAEWALRNGKGKAKRSAALYRKVASRVSVHRCADSAVEQLLEQLRQWFPLEAA